MHVWIYLLSIVCICMHVRIYSCMYACMYVGIVFYVCMHNIPTYVYIYAGMYDHIGECIYVCTCMY